MCDGGIADLRGERIARRQRVGIVAEFAFAAWVVASTWVLGYGAHATVVLNHLIVGVGIFVIASIRLPRPLATGQLAIVEAMLGAWLLAAVFVLDYSDIAERASLDWSNAIIGAAVAAVALWNAADIRVQRSRDGFASADRRG